MSKQHKASPLRMLQHELVSVHIDSAPEQHEECLFSLETAKQVTHPTDDDPQFEVELTVRFGPADTDCPTGYSGEITFQGLFEVPDRYPEEKRDLLINVTGPSILFGACREMVANLTARGKYGMLTLPSVSFVPRKPRKPRTKAAAKKVATKGKASKSSAKI
jgi:preprotein translocase subunit SecB